VQKTCLLSLSPVHTDIRSGNSTQEQIYENKTTDTPTTGW
jgi:hypothetical protein